MKRNNNKGFTLAELLIVVAVIAVLVAVAIPTFTNQLEKSRQAVDVSNLRGAYAAARLAEIDQAVGDETFKDIAGVSGAVEKLIYWYNPDSGGLTLATEGQTAAQVDGTAAQFGKATKAKATADMSQFSMTQIRSEYGTSLKTDDAGTRDKAILVQFGKTSQSGVYGIAKISFVKAAKGDATAVAVSTSSDVSVKSVQLVQFDDTDDDMRYADMVPDTVAATNSFSVYKGQAKVVAFDDLFTLVAPVGADGNAIKLDADETKLDVTNYPLSVTKDGIVSTTSGISTNPINGNTALKAITFDGNSTVTDGTYKLVFVVKAKQDMTGLNGTAKEYVTKLAVDVTISTLDTAIPDTVLDGYTIVALAAGNAENPTLSADTILAASTSPVSGAISGSINVKATKTGADDVLYDTGIKFGYSLGNSATTTTENIGELGSKVMLFDDDKIPSGINGAYLYAVYALGTETPKAVPIKNSYETPANVKVGP